jgi:hypothetical protein
MKYDLSVNYHSLHHTTARVAGISVAGKSLMQSNFNSDFYEIPRGKAEDFGIFAIRRGLKIVESRKHIN